MQFVAYVTLLFSVLSNAAVTLGLIKTCFFLLLLPASLTLLPLFPSSACLIPPSPPAGLVAQQQCVGPLQLPISDVAVFAQSHQDHTGLATSIGEQPIKGLLDPAAMARMAMGEAITNLCWASATSLADVKASVNWMYAAKMKSEGAAMYEAACALR
jgi:hypothetical protein